MKYYKQIENILMTTGYIKQADRQKILNHINIARRGNKQLRDTNKLLKRENKELIENYNRLKEHLDRLYKKAEFNLDYFWDDEGGNCDKRN